jgi:hypothetical protein
VLEGQAPPTPAPAHLHTVSRAQRTPIQGQERAAGRTSRGQDWIHGEKGESEQVVCEAVIFAGLERQFGLLHHFTEAQGIWHDPDASSDQVSTIPPLPPPLNVPSLRVEVGVCCLILLSTLCAQPRVRPVSVFRRMC